MIGQEKLRARLLLDNVSKLPNSILLVGEDGCGKHTLANEMADHYGLPLADITKSISYESIEQIYLNPLQEFYLIDMDEESERQQNALLKFLEEPLPNSHIIMLASSKAKLLGTIVNRCVAYEFAPYSRDELTQFIKEGNKDDILELCSTPGQILSINAKSLDGLHALCSNMVENLGKAKYPNALSIAKKINYKDEYDKYDFKVFLNCYRKHLMDKYMETNSRLAFDQYNLVVRSSETLLNPNINKEYFMERLITLLWERSRDESKGA